MTKDQATTLITEVTKALKEQMVSPSDLIEIDAETYKQAKMQGSEIKDFIKSRHRKVQAQSDMDL